MSKPITRPRQKPDWLRQQLAYLQQRQETVQQYIAKMDSIILQQGPDTPAHICRAHDRAAADLEEVHQQRDVLTLGWDAINAAP